MYYIIVLRSQVVAVVYRWAIFSHSFAVFAHLLWSAGLLLHSPRESAENRLFLPFIAVHCPLRSVTMAGGRGRPLPAIPNPRQPFLKIFLFFYFSLLHFFDISCNEYMTLV